MSVGSLVIVLCVQVSGVLLVAPSAVMLEARRKEFAKSMQDVLAQGQEQRATCQVCGGGGTGAVNHVLDMGL